MNRRFLALTMALALMLAAAHFDLYGHDANIFHVFGGLLALLVLCGVVLWPSSGRDQRVELALEQRNWADRINVEAAAKLAAGRGQARVRLHS